MSERRIIVEVVTPEIVKRLEAENASLRQEIKMLRQQHESLHRTLYELMEVVRVLRQQHQGRP